MAVYDFKKAEKEYYQPKTYPSYIKVPQMTFLIVDGKGAPEQEEYQEAVQILFGLSYTIKMDQTIRNTADGYFSFVVPPLEGLWWYCNDEDRTKREQWLWTAMIRQPDFVTPPIFELAKEVCGKKKPDLALSRARLVRWEEGECVQIMHVGPYTSEPASLQRMTEMVDKKGWINCTGTLRKHHEIYLGNPQKTQPEQLKTVLRIPVDTRVNGETP